MNEPSEPIRLNIELHPPADDCNRPNPLTPDSRTRPDLSANPRISFDANQPSTNVSFPNIIKFLNPAILLDPAHASIDPESVPNPNSDHGYNPGNRSQQNPNPHAFQDSNSKTASFDTDPVDLHKPDNLPAYPRIRSPGLASPSGSVGHEPFAGAADQNPQGSSINDSPNAQSQARLPTQNQVHPCSIVHIVCTQIGDRLQTRSVPRHQSLVWENCFKYLCIANLPHENNSPDLGLT